MAAVSWAPTVASLDAALATADAALVPSGSAIRADLAAAGAAYDARWSAEVSSAKDAWTSTATAAWDAADDAARYVLGGAPLAFDAQSDAALSARLVAASAVAANDTTRTIIAAQESAFRSVYYDDATSSPFAAYVAPLFGSAGTPHVSFATRMAAYKRLGHMQNQPDPGDLETLARADGLDVATVLRVVQGFYVPQRTRRGDSVRSMEADLLSLIASANTWIAAAAFT